MAKYKAGDKIVLEIESVEYNAGIPVAYVLTGGIKIPMQVFDPAVGKLVSIDDMLQPADEADE